MIATKGNFMEKTSWRDQKNLLCRTIKAVSELHGGDDIDWLRSYCREVVENSTENLQAALDAVQDVYDRTALIRKWGV